MPSGLLQFVASLSTSSMSLAPAQARSSCPGTSATATLASPLPLPVPVNPTSPPATPEQRLEALKDQAVVLQKVKEQGVDLAKKTFMSKLLGVGLSAVFTGVAAALTVATGGAAAPILAVAALRLVSVAADAACAYTCWKNVQAGRPPLPMGASGVGNLIYAVALPRVGSPEAAARLATRGAGLVALSLAVTGAVLAGMGPVASLAEKGLRIAAGALLAIQFPTDSYLVSQGATLRKSLEGLESWIRDYVQAAQAAGQAADLQAVLDALEVGKLGALTKQVEALARRLVTAAPAASVPAPATPVLSNPRVALGARTGVVMTTLEVLVMGCIGLAKALG